MANFKALRHSWDFPESVDIDDFLYPIYDLDALNGNCRGICWDGIFFHVTDPTDNKVYKYNDGWGLVDNFNLNIENTDAKGICWDGTFFYVVDVADKKVYKYNAAFVLQDSYALNASNTDARGICWDGTFFYVVDYLGSKVYEYNAAWALVDTFNLNASNTDAIGIDWNGTYFFVVDYIDIKVYQYDSAFILKASYNLNPGNINASGLCFDSLQNGGSVYVTDYFFDKVYKYGFPETKTIDGHNSSIILYDDMYEDFAAAHMTGVIELYLRSKDVTDRIAILLEDATGNDCITIEIDVSKIIGDGTDAVDPALNHKHYHIKIDFDCTPNTYDLWVDEVKELTGQAFGVNDDGSGLTKLTLLCDTSGNGYIDAIGYDWDGSYTEGDNLSDTVDVTDDITYAKIEEELYKTSVAELKIKGTAVADFEAGHEIEFYDKFDVLSWVGIVLYPESVAVAKNETVGKLKLLGLNSKFDNVYRKNFTTARDSDYIIKYIIDNFLTRYHTYDDEIDNFTITYKYDLKTKIQKMFRYLSFLERGVIGYTPDSEIFFNKYDNLKSGNQLYQGTYNFEDDIVGGNPTGWTLDESGGTINVISQYDAHKMVVEMSDTDGFDTISMYQTFIAAQTDGVIELYIGGDDVTDSMAVNVRNAVTNHIQIKINADKIQYYYDTGGGNVWVDATNGGLVNDRLYLFKIVFDCGTDTYDFYLDGILLDADIPFVAVATNLNNLFFGSATIPVDYKYYVDAIGYSWDANYTIGDNTHVFNQNTKKFKILKYTPAANRRVTRTPVIGGYNSLGQVYVIGTADEDEEDQFGINHLQTWRDSEITNFTEADQLATNLQEIYSLDTQLINALSVGKGHFNVGYTYFIDWGGVYEITQLAFLLTKRIWFPLADVCKLEFTDNILTRKDFNVKVINKLYDEDAQQSYDDSDVAESTVDGTVQSLKSIAALRADYDRDNAIGIANKRWKNCIIYASNPANNYDSWKGRVRNANTANATWYYSVPLDYIIGDRNLIITRIKLGIDDADGSNYVDVLDVEAWSDYTTNVNIYTDSTNRTAADGEYTYDPNPDLTIGGNYEQISIVLTTIVATAGRLDVTYIQVEYYYG